MSKYLILFFVLSIGSSYAQEICDNGIDDNGNGLIDLNDTLCTCTSANGGGNPASLIPNPSFEDMQCCPSTYSMLDCASDWEQATLATSDYFNTCGYIFGSVIDAGLVPFPDGEGIAGFYAIKPDYNEYIGACLISPLLSGTPYTIKMNIAYSPSEGSGLSCTMPVPPPMDLTIFGAPSCVAFPLSTFVCPPAPFVPVGSVSYTPNGAWTEVTIEFTPTFDVHTIMIGGPCALPDGYEFYGEDYCSPYFVIDNMLLNESDLFSPVSIAQSGLFCTNNVLLVASTDTTGGVWQWYEHGVALVGQTNDTLDVSGLSLDSGAYTVTYINGVNCAGGSRVLTFETEPHLQSDTTICSQPFTLSGNTSFGAGTWTNANGATFSGTEMNTTVSFPTFGSYDLVFTQNTCNYKDTLTVVYSPLPSFNLPDYSPICEGATLHLFLPDSLNLASISWGIVPIALDTLFSADLPADGYFVQIVANTGCENDTSFSIANVPTVALYAPSYLCVDSTDLTTNTGPAAGLWGYVNSAGVVTFDDPTALNTGFHLSQPGDYTLFFTDATCHNSDTLHITYIGMPDISLPQEIKLCVGEQFAVTADINYPEYLSDFHWSNGWMENTIVVGEQGYYTAIGTNICGVSADSVHVLIDFCELNTPNVFTPNSGDTINGGWKLIGAPDKYEEFSCVILNRWGQKMYEFTDPFDQWDGTTGGLPAHEGVYFYLVRLVTTGGTEFVKQGFFQLVR